MDIDQIIKERLKVIPKDIKEVFESVNLNDKFKSISDKYNLLIDQSGSLQNETILTMLGIENIKDYIDNIQTNLEIPRDLALKISQDVNTQIFYPIRSSLQKLQQDNTQADRVVQPTPTQQPSFQRQAPPTPTPVRTQPQQPITRTLPKTTMPSIPNINSNLPPMLKTVPIVPTTNMTIPAITIESAGKLTLEKPIPKTTQYNETTPIKEHVLRGIEDPETPKPMIDHLLSTPVQSTQKLEVQKQVIPEIPKQAPKPVEPSIPYTSDPYREQI